MHNCSSNSNYCSSSCRNLLLEGTWVYWRLPLTRGTNFYGKLISAYGCIDFSSYSGGLRVKVGWPRPESAAAQRWSSTIGCPAWQPRPRCTAVLRDRCVYMTCVVGRAVCLGYIKVNIIIIIIIINCSNGAWPISERCEAENVCVCGRLD